MSRLQTLTCPNCGSPEVDAGLRCSACDSQLTWNSGVTGLLVAGAGTQCPKCRQANPSGNRFCATCGERLLLVCLACEEEHPLGTLVCPATGVSYREIHEVAAQWAARKEEAERAQEAAEPERELAERHRRLAERLRKLDAPSQPDPLPVHPEFARRNAFAGGTVGFLVALPLAWHLSRLAWRRTGYEDPLYVFRDGGIALTVFLLFLVVPWVLGTLQDRRRHQEGLQELLRQRAARREALARDLEALAQPDAEVLARADREWASARAWLEGVEKRYAARGVRIRGAMERLGSG